MMRNMKKTLWCCLLAGLTGLGGCTSAEKSASNDPLLGAPTVRPQPPAGGASAANAGTPSPPGTPTALTSNAALASGGRKDLRIADSFQKPGTVQMPGATSTQPITPGTTPVPTTPTTPTTPTNGGAAAPTTTVNSATRQPMSNGRIMTYEEAQAMLASRGVTWQRLETWGDKGEWKFSCSIPNKKNNYISRNYEARSTDYLSAIRAVMDQIEREP